MQLGIQPTAPGQLQMSGYKNAGHELPRGKRVATHPRGEQYFMLPASDQAGIYYLKMYGADGVYVTKVILQ